MTMFRKIIISTLASIGILASTGAVFAVPASATTALNVRSGPGTGFNVLDKLHAGEAVEVTECVSNGWCRIEHNGPDGWVSANYLQAPAPTPPSPTPTPQQPNPGTTPECNFGLVLGANGPSFSIACGDGSNAPTMPIIPGSTSEPIPQPPTPTSSANGVVCLYTLVRQGGDELCQETSTHMTLNGTFNDQISSLEIYGSAEVTLCQNANLGGRCITYSSSADTLEPFIDNQASSLQITSGATFTPPAAPVTLSSGPMNLREGYRGDLDNGDYNAGRGADIWYQIASPAEKYLAPVNGATMALGNRSNRGFSGCSVANYSPAKIPLWSLPVGSYVCVKTNLGHTSQFRLNGYAGNTIQLGYTTFTN